MIVRYDLGIFLVAGVCKILIITGGRVLRDRHAVTTDPKNSEARDFYPGPATN